MAEATIEAYYLEDRTFPPPEDFRRNALVSDSKLYEEAEADWEGFWARQARDLVTWFDDFDTVLEWDLPFRLLERRAGWAEVRVGADLQEQLVPAAAELAGGAELLAPEAPEGGRVPLQDGAAGWLREATNAVGRGLVVTFDYVDTTPSLASSAAATYPRRRS